MVGMAGGVVERAAAKARGMGRRLNDAAAVTTDAPTRARNGMRRPSMVGGTCVNVWFGRAGRVEAVRTEGTSSSECIGFCVLAHFTHAIHTPAPIP